LDDIILEVVFLKELISLHPEVVREEGVHPELTSVPGETK
jgi:uncharacterized protein (UPF0305 family)